MPSKVLRVKELNYSNIIKKVTFDLHQGEIVALMGENGSGKSTLAKVLTGLMEPSSGQVQLFQGESLCPWGTNPRWREVALVGQHPRRQTIGASVAEELGFGLLNQGFNVQEVRAKVKELVCIVGLQGKENQSPSTLSGGERQRLVTAAILALNPAFLILDEALTMLDQRAQTQILALLFKEQEKIGQLWITHDPEVAKLADRLLLIKNGHLVDVGDPSVLEDIELRSNYGIRSSRNEPYHKRKPDQLCNKDISDSDNVQLELNVDTSVGESTPTEAEHGFPLPLIEVGVLEVDENNHICMDDLDSEDNSAVPMVQKVSKSPVLEWKAAVYGTRLFLDKVVRSGEFIGILGPSGAGKSTILESVIGLNRPTQGSFSSFGEILSQANLSLLRRRSRLVLQEPGEYFIGHTVYDEVFYGLKRSKNEREKEVNLNYLQQQGIHSNLAFRTPERLSGGERQRVALAAALQTMPDIFLLDEPMLGLDGPGRELLNKCLNDLRGSLTVLYVSHDLEEVLDCANRLWLVENGQVTLDCPARLWSKHLHRWQEAGVRI
ncbi:MAG: ABC transporter ATP-binding protein [Desulfitobacteriaceae bacterium]